MTLAVQERTGTRHRPQGRGRRRGAPDRLRVPAVVHPVPHGRQRAGERGQPRHPVRHRPLPLLGLAHRAPRGASPTGGFQPGAGGDARPARRDARRLRPRHGRPAARRRDQHRRLGPAAAHQPRRGRAARRATASATTTGSSTVLRRLAFAAGLVALLGLAQYATGELFVDRIRIPGLTAGTEGWTLGTRSGFIRPSGTSMSPIEYGVVLGMTLPLAIVCASVQSRYRWLYRAMLVAMIASIFFSMSRSAYLCSLAGMLVLALSWDLRRRLARARLLRGGQRGDVRGGAGPARLDPGAVLQRRRGPEHRLADRQLRHRRRSSSPAHRSSARASGRSSRSTGSSTTPTSG